MPAYFWAILLIATTCQAIWEQVSTGKRLLRGLAPPETRNRVQAVFIAEQAAQMRLLHERDNYGREGAAPSDASSRASFVAQCRRLHRVDGRESRPLLRD